MTDQKYFNIPDEITYQDSHFSVLLRPLKVEDAEPIHEAMMCSLDDFRPFMDWAHQDLSVEKQIERIQESKKPEVQFDVSVFEKNTGEFLMSATLRPSPIPNKKSLSIGYWTSSKHCNKGLATLITKVLIVIAFDYMRCDRVEITCNKANKKSIRVMEKCGFVFESQIRNYFTEPTIEMLENGYCPDRTCLQYALIPQDLMTLSWFEAIRDKLVIKP